MNVAALSTDRHSCVYVDVAVTGAIADISEEIDTSTFFSNRIATCLAIL